MRMMQLIIMFSLLNCQCNTRSTLGWECLGKFSDVVVIEHWPDVCRVGSALLSVANSEVQGTNSIPHIHRGGFFFRIHLLFPVSVSSLLLKVETFSRNGLLGLWRNLPLLLQLSSRRIKKRTKKEMLLPLQLRYCGNCVSEFSQPKKNNYVAQVSICYFSGSLYRSNSLFNFIY